MKIFNVPLTKDLPKTVAECSGSVCMVFDDGSKLPINENESAMRLFQKLWENSGREGVELICADSTDNFKFLRMMSMVY